VLKELPPSLEESRVPVLPSRSQRSRHARRRLFTGLVVVQVVLLGVAGVLEATGTIDLIRGPGDSGQAGGESPVAAAGPLSGAAADPSGDPSSSIPPTVRHRLTVTSHPSGAALAIERNTGSTRKAKTPFEGSVAEGEATLRLTLQGYNTLVQPLTIDGDLGLDLWLDPKGLLHHKLGEFETGSAPKQVAFSPDGSEIWVTLLGESGLEVYDAATFDRLAEVPTGKYGTVEVIFTSDGGTAFASQMQTASVFEIDTATHTVRRQLITGSAWSKILALSPDERTLFVANWSGDNVTDIDLTTGRVRRQLPTVDTPRGLFVSANGERLFVAGFADGDVERIDLATGESTVLLRTGGAMRHLVGDTEEGLLYADDMGTDEVYVIDLRSGKASKLADTDNTPNTIDLTPNGRVLYVSNRGANGENYNLPGPEWGSVLAIDTATGKVLDAIVGGNQTTGLDVSPDGLLLAFSDFLDNRVSVYAVPEYEVLASGGGGRAVAHLAELDKG
jgi:DNA-binding beta-propeller fold protein YncE